MRWLTFFLALALCARAIAGPLPLTNKEIVLMLRTGYSSETVLAELQQRHAREALDPAAKKAMVEFGAGAQLIAALESGAYVLSNSEAERARAREAEVAASRQAQIEQDRNLNTLLQAQQAQARVRIAAATQAGARIAEATPAGETPVLDSLKSKLVRCRDGATSSADGSELDGKKYVALYYSAHWCGPCRKFTPSLVDYYNRVAAAHPDFEIIFISCDRSRAGWETYIRETKMPWLAVDYDQVAGLGGVRSLGGTSIPSLLVLDRGSHIVASTYEGDKYLGPQNALATLDQIFAGKPPTAVAQSREAEVQAVLR